MALLLAGGCRTAGEPPPVVPPTPAPEPVATSDPIADPEPHIRLQRLEDGRWRVTYHLARPAETLRFWRPAQWFREPTWTVTTPGYRLARDGNSQVLTLDSGAEAQDEITVEFIEHTAAMMREYRPVQRFTDGAAALYTGHLYVRDTADEVDGEDPRGDDRPDAPYLDTLELIADPTSTVIVPGTERTSETTIRWTDPTHDGTYVYFGAPGLTVPLSATVAVDVIVDPGMPVELRDRLVALFEPMLHALAVGHRFELPWRPMVLVAWEPGREGNRHWEGGTRTGMVHMTLGGGGWDLQKPETLRNLAHFVGHESTHFWNGTVVRNQGAPWMHEGGADAIADLVMVQLGLMDHAAQTQSRERAINRCLSTLAGTGLGNIERRHGHRVHYTCGYLMAVWSEAAVGSAGLMDLWATLIERAGPARTYAQPEYFASLEALGAEPGVLAAMRAFIDEDSQTQVDDVTAGFAAVGLALNPARRPPSTERARLAGKALGHLQQIHCGGRSVSTFDDHLRTYVIKDCPAFAIEADIHRVSGIRVTDGDRVHNRVRARCARGRSIKLSDDDGTTVLTVPCTEALAPRPPWLSLSR